MGKYVEIIKRAIHNLDRTAHLLDAIAQGIANQSRLFNEKLNQVIEGMDNQARTSNQKFDEAIEGLKNRSHAINEKLNKLIENQQAQLELQRAQGEIVSQLSRAAAPNNKGTASPQGQCPTI